MFIRAKIRIARQNNLPRADFTKHLQAEINQIIPQQTSLFVEQNRPIPKLHWNNSDTALLELMIALQRSGAIVAEEADDEDEALNKAMESNYVAFNYQAVDSDNYETYWNEAEITEHKEEKDD